VKIKICGITNLEDALIAAACGADVLGFNFYPNSPRYIEPGAARDIIDQLPPEIEKVGVFVNSGAEAMAAIARECSLDVVQLHGDEDEELIAELRAISPSRVMRAIRVTPAVDLERYRDYPADDFLLDSESRGYGGSGEVFDWRSAIAFKNLIPHFFLAGGLDPQNVAEAIRLVRPAGVDVCSGVEETKRKKDRRKVEEFIRKARSAQ
jgi:phosphoribosylanthranilate isomerase